MAVAAGAGRARSGRPRQHGRKITVLPDRRSCGIAHSARARRSRRVRGRAAAAYRLGHRHRGSRPRAVGAARCGADHAGLFAAGDRLQPQAAACRPRSRRSARRRGFPAITTSRRPTATRAELAIFRPYQEAVGGGARRARGSGAADGASSRCTALRRSSPAWRGPGTRACCSTATTGSPRRCCALLRAERGLVAAANEPYRMNDRDRLHGAGARGEGGDAACRAGDPPGPDRDGARGSANGRNAWPACCRQRSLRCEEPAA